ncbi:MAG: hypothetical protein IPK08_17820 [Bacteroidetes bacterium]|nr:hypothetical protein [Bacteroidota bacterium]
MKNSIAALRKMGKEKLADKLEKRQSDFNLSIISAFNTKFKFVQPIFSVMTRQKLKKMILIK